MARNRVLQSGVTGSANIAMGLGAFGATGLILGSVLGQALATAMIARPFLAKARPRAPGTPTMAAVAKTYIAYPKLLLPSHLIGAGHASIAVLFITAVFSSTATGYFSLASRLMGLPTSLVSAAIGDVFRQRATELYHQNGEFRDIWVKTFKHIAGLGILPFALYAVLAPSLFEILFGEEWRVAGEYARILTVQFFFTYLCAALDKSALIVGANRYIFLWNLSRFLANIVGSAVAYLFDFSIEHYLYLLASINIFFYTVSMAVEYRFSLGQWKSATSVPV
jgi:O-antigen/teichoic acid export membrane protein